MRSVDARLLAGLSLVLLWPGDASAHFVLEEPECSTAQDFLGNPQKQPPCGGNPGSPTGAITAFQSGQTITITIDETIFHAGHYRVSIAPNDPSRLPPEPIVTPDTRSPCGSTTIMDPPVYPVLADGMLLHSSSFSGSQSFEVTLPTGMTCDHCTLQILEFMHDHELNVPGGCFYHHCATISIQDVLVEDAGMSMPEDGGTSVPTDTGAPPRDTGTSSGADAGRTTSPPQACACSTPGRGASRASDPLAISTALLAVSLVLRRRARRR